MRRLLCWILFVLGLAVPASAAPRPYVDFLRDVVDLDRLAVLPPDGVTCKQFSSYDRASKIGDDGKLIDWGANGDCGKFLRQDPEGAVLAEMDGPGAIVRIWSANPAGTLKVYIDGAAEPTFQQDFRALCEGKVPDLPQPIVGMHASGGNCFLPMPYQKKCKVVVEKPGNLYYHVDYWTFTPGTEVQPFHWPLADAQKTVLAGVQQTLAAAGEQPRKLAEANVAKGQANMEPGQTKQVYGYRGKGALVALKMRPTLPEELKDARQALEGLQISITFDGAKQPQVHAPLGHFFGTAPGLNLFSSLSTGVTKDGCYSYWYMPFATGAVVTVRNAGQKAVPLSWEITRVPLAKPMSELMYFHAGYRREYPNKVFDWPWLEAEGRGRFVGAALSVWNPNRGWWGEGDEKVWVDGEKFPSWFGTGSEDYFGYAWCSTTLFSHALHAQPLCEGPGNANYTSVNRWHIADNIPFQKQFKMTIENYANDKDYAAVAYWYQAPGGSDFFQPEIAVRELQEPRPIFKIAGALEGEALKITGKQIAAVDPQDMGGFNGNWSNASHLWLRPAKAGEWVELALPVKEAGRYEVVVYLTKAIDYGIAQFSVNGQALGKPFDGFHDGVVASGPVSLGTLDLPAGDAKLRLEVTGKNEKATGFMAGLDAVVLKKQ